MSPLDNNGRYAPFAKVEEKCGSLAQKWNSSRSLGWSFQKQLVRWVQHGKLTLYCFKIIPPGSEKRFFIIKGHRLDKVIDRWTSIIDTPFLIDRSGSSGANIDWIGQPESKVEVSRFDLYIDLDELAILDEQFWVEARTETDPQLENPNSTGHSDNSKATLGPTFIRRRPIIIGKGQAEETVPASRQSEMVPTVYNQPPLPVEIEGNFNLVDQAMGLSNSCQLDKTKAESEIATNVGPVDPLLSKDDSQ